MLELLAQIDPMTLPLWATLLLAASMYPLGFMLGAPCSGCCCQINKCNFHSGLQYLCRPIMDYPSVAASVSIDGHTKAVDDFELNWYLVGTSNVSIPFTSPVYGECTVTSIRYEYMANQDGEIAVCQEQEYVARCQYTVRFRAIVSSDDCYQDPVGEFYTEYQPWFENGNRCEANSVTATLEAVFAEGVSDIDSDDLAEAVLAYLNGVSASASISYDACGCGACCGGEGGCEDDVAEHLCDEDVAVWKGAGSRCDEVECSEGACCDPEGGCVDVASGEFCAFQYRAGVSCAENACSDIGACCDEAGNCSQETFANCFGGSWTEGVECDPNPCPQPPPPPTGACCDEAGNCTQTTAGECFGVAWTEGVDCDPNPCI